MTAKIWYYPDPAGAVVEIDIGEGLSDLQKNGAVVQSASESVSGAVYTNQTSARSMVRVINERFTSYALARQLETLENHLRRGGVIAVAEESSKAFAGYLNFPLPSSGATSFSLQGTPWPFAGVITLAGGNEFVLQSPSPKYLRELGLLTSHGAGNTMTVPATVYDYSAEPWVLFRTRGFWPLLRLPVGQRNQKMLTHDHRISWTFDVQLEEHVDGLDIFAGIADSEVVTATPLGGVIQQTVPEILDLHPPGVGGGLLSHPNLFT